MQFTLTSEGLLALPPTDFSFGSCGGMVWNERTVYLLKLVKSSRRSIPAGRGLTGCPAEKAPGVMVETELNMSQVRIRQSGLITLEDAWLAE